MFTGRSREFSPSPATVTAGTRQRAQTRKQRDTDVLGPSERLAPAPAAKAGIRWDVVRGGGRAYTIRFGHHRKLPDMQDAGRAYLLRSSSGRTAGFRNHEVCHRVS